MNKYLTHKELQEYLKDPVIKAFYELRQQHLKILM